MKLLGLSSKFNFFLLSKKVEVMYKMSKKNPKKIKIIISDKDDEGNKHRFCDSVTDKASKFYVDVGFNAFTYGGGSPCIGKKEVNNAIENAKKTILREHDIPIIDDLRIKRTLMDFFLRCV